ncbi:hypothetical protein D6817_03985 [Candidatus Pacearchaeota archaeon]|nr:MAG: hypothetical protein D6817_03985 [Candidatus Pacearchaeota archaeon]
MSEGRASVVVRALHFHARTFGIRERIRALFYLNADEIYEMFARGAQRNSATRRAFCIYVCIYNFAV